MHIMLFGGAFDPPHNGHLSIAREVLAQNIADQIWFIPCATHPFGKMMTPAADRLTMLQLAGDIIINTYELDTPTTSFTIDTIKHFAKTRPEDTFSWLIGSDQLPSFARWERWQELIHSFTVFVYPREGFSFEKIVKGMVALSQLPMVTISSTMIREQVRQNMPIAELVPAKVVEYIVKKKLYVE